MSNPLGRIFIRADIDGESRQAVPPSLLVNWYALFQFKGFEFLVVDVQVANCPPVTDGRFGYTIVERRTGMGAKEVCEMTVEGAVAKGLAACEKNWSDRVEAALRTWKVLNP